MKPSLFSKPSRLPLQVLGRGRIIECSVCGNKWFQTAERALTLTENFLMKVRQRQRRRFLVAETRRTGARLGSFGRGRQPDHADPNTMKMSYDPSSHGGVGSTANRENYPGREEAHGFVDAPSCCSPQLPTRDGNEVRLVHISYRNPHSPKPVPGLVVHRQDWTEERARDAAESVKRFAGFDLFVGNIPFSVSEKVRRG